MLKHKKAPAALKDCPGEDCPGCESAMCMADGGQVSPKPVTMTLPPKTASDLSKGMSGGISWAKGGEVEPKEAEESPSEEHEGDDEEIHHMLGKEMMSALESKDHKRIMDGLEACVLSCMNKHKGQS